MYSSFLSGPAASLWPFLVPFGPATITSCLGDLSKADMSKCLTSYSAKRAQMWGVRPDASGVWGRSYGSRSGTVVV